MSKTLFILGAGFTKAFIKKAFLSLDKGHVTKKLRQKYPKTTHPYAHSILDYQITSQGVDIERLMTRLHTLMPHDFEKKCTQELEHLYHDIKDDFINRLQKLKDATPELPKELNYFAKWCIENEADCISFNYDDFLDDALYSYNPKDDFHASHSSDRFWHPTSGYGFFCRPANSCIKDQNLLMGSSAMLLLKLHGSINWRIKLGASNPCQLDSILHYEKWIPPLEGEAIHSSWHDNPVKIENHLKPERLLVLPVLQKTDIVQQPVFRRIWSEAFDRLRQADRVIFIGYSMPLTDIATGFLLREALQVKKDIKVVNSVDPSSPQSHALVSAYQSVIPSLTKDNFYFGDAISWIPNHLPKYCG